MQFYNFWGVAPENKPTHPWQGLTTFKLGFGGERHHFLHAQDLPLSPFYWISFWYQKLWNWKRGYN
jgi:lipid II:glycine glycyltransferase (peptidoglycan interpeptide bridge formation enzyme)